MISTVTIDVTAAGAAISPDIYGQYLEHVEDCVDPGLIDDHGLRRDVMELSRDLGVPAIRWPGGCFADLYHWADGIGPDRPVRPNWHWGGEPETNRFGTHEFLDWCEQVGAGAYINTNLGTGSLTEALRWLDYCTGTADTDDVRRRRANGRNAPWPVRYWGIGNETWGPWEAGHTDAAQYARTLANWADFFHRYDPDATIVGVGSSEGRDPDWNRTVLDAAGDHLGLLSLHVYGATVLDPPGSGDTSAAERSRRRAGLAYFPAYVEKRIAAMAAVVDDYNTRHATSIGIALDEWNIRHWESTDDGYRLVRADPRTGTDALCAAGFFHAMLQHADLLQMGNYVFLVNGHGVINARDGRGEPTALFPVFREYQRWLTGVSLPVHVDCPTESTPPMLAGSPDHEVAGGDLPPTLPVLDAVASRDGAEVRLAVINRSELPVDVDLQLGGTITRRHQFVVNPPADTLQVATPEITGPRTQLPPLSITFVAFT